MDLVRSAPGGILDLNKVATKLGLRKLRVYDNTNVLDGSTWWKGSPRTTFGG